MDKIKEALERARKERLSNQNKPGERAGTSISNIEYTHTRSILGSNAVMRENRILDVLDNDKYSDAFKILSTQILQRMNEFGWSTLGITGPVGNEGSTLTTINLGISIAKELDYTVLVVDTNLREPGIHNYFGTKPEYGLSDFLLNDIDLAEILFKPDNINHFVILPGKFSIANSSEMLASQKMSNLVQELKSRYAKRIILFDLPPLLNTADALSFSPYLDALLLVAEDDVTKEEDLRKSKDLLTNTNIIGVALNKSIYGN